MSDLYVLLAESSSESWWAGTFFGLDADQRFILLLTAMGCATAVIITLAGIAYSWADSVSRRHVEADMKREMLDRGMSADEIAKVIEAAPLEDAASRWVASWCKSRKK